MRYIEAPNHYTSAYPWTTEVFLAGGITGCPDWQSELVALLGDQDLVLYNPRRINYVGDWTAEESKKQIEWEFHYLHQADVVSFWFPAENAAGCPITLFELGTWLSRSQLTTVLPTDIVIGVEPGYVREADVRIQTSLYRPDINIVDSLPALAKQIFSYA